MRDDLIKKTLYTKNCGYERLIHHVGNLPAHVRFNCFIEPPFSGVAKFDDSNAMTLFYMRFNRGKNIVSHNATDLEIEIDGDLLLVEEMTEYAQEMGISFCILWRFEVEMPDFDDFMTLYNLIVSDNDCFALYETDTQAA